VSVSFIGDVHAWSDRLDRLLARLDGPLVFMGDLIDRGPDAPGVLARVRALCAEGRARCLLGNHEYALLRSLGSERLALAGDPDFFAAWREGFGGAAVLAAYGVGDADSLKAALGDALDWMAQLPWMLEGEEGGQRWIAVHAGLAEERPFAMQLAELRAGWAAAEVAAEALFSKSRAFALPDDFPDDCTLVSGHVPLPQAYITGNRILCDTSGGQRFRALSAVVWPEGRVVSSES
jgi:serine/threonine protein phosphatase 1